MSDWVTNTLKQLTDIRVSNVDKHIRLDESAIKLCNYMDVYSNLYINDRIDFQIGSVNNAEYGRFCLQKGDVLITKDSETPEDIAVSAVVEEDIESLVCGYHLAILRPKTDRIDGFYLMHFLRLPKTNKHFLRVANGSTRYGLVIGDIEITEIHFPSDIDEQRKIASILRIVDKVIEKTEAAIEKYQAIKAGMMQDLFTRGIDTKTGKLRPTFEEAPELYKESELGWIPKEWEAGRFGDICKVKAGYSFKSSEFGSNGYRLIRISNIQEYTVKNLENDVFITPNLSTQEYELKLGDLLIALSGATTGKVGLVKRESLPALLNQRVGLFEPQDNTSIDYVYQIVSDDSYQKSILDNCPSSAQPNVSPKYLEAVLIKYAKDQHEQALIVRLLKSIDSTIEAEYNQLKKSLKLKQGLMADLLSGKVRVNLNHDKVENR